MNKIYLITIFILSFVTSACSQTSDKVFNAEELFTLIHSKEKYVIIDVRTPPELTGQLGAIEGVLNIPLQELARRTGEIEKYKNVKIALICRSGRRSGIAQKMLADKGIETYNVAGGMIAYNRFLNAR